MWGVLLLCFLRLVPEEEVSFEKDEEVKGDFKWFKRRLRGTFRSFQGWQQWCFIALTSLWALWPGLSSFQVPHWYFSSSSATVRICWGRMFGLGFNSWTGIHLDPEKVWKDFPGLRRSIGKEKRRSEMRKTNVSTERLPEAELTELQALQEGKGGRGRGRALFYLRDKCWVSPHHCAIRPELPDWGHRKKAAATPTYI